MRIMAPGSIPVFLYNAVIGSQPGPPLIISLDAYYDQPLVVGFSVVGSEEEDPIGSFFAELVIDED